MIIYVIEFTTNLLFILSIIFLSLSLTGRKITDTNMVTIILSVLSVFLNSLFAVKSSPLGYTVLSIMILLFITYLYSNCNIKNLLIIHIISFSILGILQAVPLIFLPQTDNSINSPQIQICGQLIILFLCMFMYFKLPLYKLYKNNNIISKFLKYVFVIIYLFLIYASIYSKYNAKDALSILPFIITFIVVVIYLTYQNYIQQQHYVQLETQFADYKKYQPVFEDLVEHIRLRQHEFDNQLMALKALPLTHKDYDSLAYALTNNTSEIMTSIQNSSLLKLNLKVLAAFLFSKVTQAQKNNIHVGIIIKNSYIHTIVVEHELLEIVGILIDNAVEAVDTNDSITVYIDSRENKVEITTINKGPIITPEMRKLFFEKNYSTKEPTDNKKQRGVGLYHLKQIIDSYHGTILLDNEFSSGENLVIFQVTV